MIEKGCDGLEVGRQGQAILGAGEEVSRLTRALSLPLVERFAAWAGLCPTGRAGSTTLYYSPLAVAKLQAVKDIFEQS